MRVIEIESRLMMMTMIVFNIIHAAEEKFDKGYDSDGFKGTYWGVTRNKEDRFSDNEGDDDNYDYGIKEVLLRNRRRLLLPLIVITKRKYRYGYEHKCC